MNWAIAAPPEPAAPPECKELQELLKACELLWLPRQPLGRKPRYLNFGNRLMGADFDDEPGIRVVKMSIIHRQEPDNRWWWPHMFDDYHRAYEEMYE